MKKIIAAAGIVVLSIAFLASLEFKTCYKDDFHGYTVHVDIIKSWRKTTRFVVLYPTIESLPIIRGVYTGSVCEFLTLTGPHRFAAEPAKSEDPSVKQSFAVMEQARVAVQVDKNIVRPAAFSLWRFVPASWFL